MKKYFMNDNWELESVDSTADLFLLVVEQNAPACSYVYKYDTSPETIQPDYLNFINQYEESEVESPLKVHIIKVPNTKQICNQVSLADSEHKGTTEEAIEAINAMLNRADCEFLESWAKQPLVEKKRTKKKRAPYDSASYTTGCLGMNLDFFNSHFGTGSMGDTTFGDKDCFNGACSDGFADSSSGGEGGGFSESLHEAKDEEDMPIVEHIIIVVNADEPTALLTKNCEEDLH